MTFMPSENNDFLMLIIICFHISMLHQVFVCGVENIPSGATHTFYCGIL